MCQHESVPLSKALGDLSFSLCPTCHKSSRQLVGSHHIRPPEICALHQNIPDLGAWACLLQGMAFCLACFWI
eukprot:6826135-Heterocapsa_arctica.AAC.1